MTKNKLVLKAKTAKRVQLEGESKIQIDRTWTVHITNFYKKMMKMILV